MIFMCKTLVEAINQIISNIFNYTYFNKVLYFFKYKYIIIFVYKNRLYLKINFKFTIEPKIQKYGGVLPGEDKLNWCSTILWLR